ncbi:beta-phosphoglucomutase [Hydromonas duriensis]|uniref:Beta-phosphoglucomutase n=1 Tax=Hydromonas duriensis TaxID=1527608 RepID=A0A4R6Y6A8_9BURK|nr:beta-phosphoglucomutase [Hydromonas duriensis]TDR31138.1 beta-phosphoglucomutase [Hydromonas duriensis]
MSSIKAFIFDLDGVITDTAKFHFIAWQKLAHRLGFDIDHAFNETLKGVGRMDSLNLILKHGGLTLSDAEKEVHAAQKNDEYVELIADMSTADLLPGARAALESIRAAGLRTGLASASKNASTILARLGVTDLFDTIVDARDVINGKPDPEIFLKGAQQLGLSPSECIGVEDAVAGIQAIKSAGMFAIGIGEPSVLTQADKVIAGLQFFDLDEFIQLAQP